MEANVKVEHPKWVPLTTRVVTDICYCGICSMPVEYCEYSGSFEKCIAWTKKNASKEYKRLYSTRADLPTESTDELTSKTAELTVAEDVSSDPKKAAGKQKKDERKKLAQLVTLKLDKRKGKKQVTIITGLDMYDVELKKASKLFSNKFCCGSSISKNAEGKEEIIVQGEFLNEIKELLMKEYSQLQSEMIRIL